MINMGNKLIIEKESYKIIIILILLAFSVFLTYYFHFIIGTGTIFTHIFYFPIILAAIWWRSKGLIVPLFLSILLITSYFLAPNLNYPLYEDLFRGFIFMAIGVVVAILSEEIHQKDINLFESQEKFQSVAMSAVDGIITTDTDGMIVLFNNSLKNIFGYSIDEIKGKHVTMLMPERFKLKFIEKLDRFKNTGNHELDGKTFESIGLRKDGVEFPFEISIATWGSKGDIFTTSIIRDVSERKKIEKQLKKSLYEKEILLKEIHHRVKNNLMIISSLLNLQSKYIKDEESKNIFKESQNRAKSMALIHERLYNSKDLKRIDFGDYINTLAHDLYHTYVIDNNLIELNVNVDDLMLDINTSIPLGLIVNELVTNSLKHAFPRGRSGKIEINFHLQDDKYILEVKDKGIGFPEDIDYKNTDSLGLRLVTILTEQIEGVIEFNNTSGTSFKIIFKEEKFDENI
jgi:PAS domain S-box-containing protein